MAASSSNEHSKTRPRQDQKTRRIPKMIKWEVSEDPTLDRKPFLVSGRLDRNTVSYDSSRVSAKSD